jgi:hypothetical protein
VAAVKIHLERFEVQQVQQFVERGGHPSIMACQWAGSDLG